MRDFWRDLKELWDKMWSLWRKRPTRHVMASAPIIIRFQNGKIISVLPERICWTPPTKEEEKKAFMLLDGE